MVVAAGEAASYAGEPNLTSDTGAFFPKGEPERFIRATVTRSAKSLSIVFDLPRGYKGVIVHADIYGSAKPKKAHPGHSVDWNKMGMTNLLSTPGAWATAPIPTSFSGD